MKASIARRASTGPRTDWRQWKSPIQDWHIDSARSLGKPFDTRLRRFDDAILVDARLGQSCFGDRRKGASGFVVVMFIADGCETGALGAQRFCFQRGDVVVWNSRQENLRFEIAKPLHKVMFFMPAERVEGLWPDLISTSILHFSSGNSFSPFLVSHFNAFMDQLDTLTDPCASAVVDVGTQLVASAARAARACDARGPRTLTIDQAVRYLEANLRDPDIDPDRVAAHFGISTRYLQILFAEKGMTVSDLIRQRRLENCRRALQSKAPGETITDIALTWGFNDPSHFSRLFRQRFGMTPKAYARRHAAEIMDGG